MHYNREYINELENCIMDELIPMYIVGCRASGRDPNVNPILKRLLEARELKQQIPILLQKPK